MNKLIKILIGIAGGLLAWLMMMLLENQVNLNWLIIILPICVFLAIITIN